MAAKLIRLTHKIAIRLHLVAESCTICSSRSWRPVRKLLDTPSYIAFLYTVWKNERRTHHSSYSFYYIGMWDMDLTFDVSRNLSLNAKILRSDIGCMRVYPDWPPGERTASGRALCH
jgi:hypothetical protein